MRFLTLIIILACSLEAKNSLTFTNFENDTLYYILPGPEESLTQDINDILLDPSLLNANIGVSVYSITEREYLFRKNSNKNFVPASLMKLITTYSSLFFLGKEYKFTTEIYYRGLIGNDGRLDGDLIIFSNGDPTLNPYFTSNSDSLFYVWIESIEKLGINSITGNIIADVSWFDNQKYPDGWQSGDLQFDYAAPVSVFNYNNNRLELTIKPGNETGGLAKIEVKPELYNSFFKNKIITIETNNYKNISIEKDNLRINNNVIFNDYVLTGSIGNKPSDFLIKKSISNQFPEYFYLNVFKDLLIESNISINGKIILKDISDTKIDYNECVLIDQNFSEELTNIIKTVNKESDNLLAETLIKSIAKEKTGFGSFENGLGQIEKLIDDIGINSKNIRIDDGSGLSRMNLLSPNSLIKLLTYIEKTEDFELFQNTLASPGEGTLENRMINSLAVENLWAKTGTMSNISNIAGYIKTQDNELLAFSILFNNFTAPINSVRNLQDLICMRLSAFTRDFKIEKSKLQNLPEKPSSSNKSK